MKIRVMWATTLATMKKTAFTLLCCAPLMLFAAPAWADQCSTPVGSATGCGALITVGAVNESGKATAFVVMIAGNGNGNPYDATESSDHFDDSLIGIQNNSGANLTSITLSSSSSPIFGFDGDGPCQFSEVCFGGATGYEGPDNTFTIASNTSGTVNFTTAILNGGSTWFALEGTPQSITRGLLSRTFILQPGVTVSVPVGSNEYRFKPINNVGGESLTITAVPIQESIFNNTDPAGQADTCAPVKDFSTAAGADTCMEFQTECLQGNAPMDDCATFQYQVKWIFDLPSDRLAIGGPDWGINHDLSCPLVAGQFPESIFAGYSVSKTDPVYQGGDHKKSCNAPEWTTTAPVITTAAGFVGFEPPVSNTELNRIEAEQTVPLKWNLSDRFGTPVPNLTLCTDPTAGCTVPWVVLQSTRIACRGKKTPKTVGLKLLDGDFKNQGNGEYRFNWETDEDSRGCVTVVLNFELASGAALVTVSPANFKFKIDE